MLIEYRKHNGIFFTGSENEESIYIIFTLNAA